jgi:hypothetical protein
MRTPAIQEYNGQDEETKSAGLITAKLVDITMRWLPIKEYEEGVKESPSPKMTGKKI